MEPTSVAAPTGAKCTTNRRQRLMRAGRPVTQLVVYSLSMVRGTGKDGRRNMAEQPQGEWPDAPYRPAMGNTPESPGDPSDAGFEMVAPPSAWVRARPFAAAFVLMLAIIGGLHAWGQVAATYDDPVAATLAAARDAVIHSLSAFSPSGRASAPVAVAEAAPASPVAPTVVATPQLAAPTPPPAKAAPAPAASLQTPRGQAFVPPVVAPLALPAPPYQPRASGAPASPAAATRPTTIPSPPPAPQPTVPAARRPAAAASFTKPVSGLPSRPPAQAVAPAARSSAPVGAFTKPVSGLPLRPPAQAVAPAAARPPVAAASRPPAAAPALTAPVQNSNGWIRPAK